MRFKELRKLAQLKKIAPVVVKVTGLSHYKRNFRREGYYSGLVVNKWKDKKKPNGKKILKGSGRLQRSITGRVRTSGVIFRSGLPYASVHNQGYKGKQNVRAYTRRTRRKSSSGRKGRKSEGEVKAHTRNQNIPKRTFMNMNKKLKKEIISNLKRELKKL